MLQTENQRIDKLTGVKSFVHTPQRLETAKRLATFLHSKAASKLVEGKRATKESLHSQHGAIRPVKPRLLPCKTTKQNWHCGWCHICWHGEKVCEDWIYAITCSYELAG